MMKRVLLLVSIFLAGLTLCSRAQSFQTAIGVRIGEPSGITVLHYMSPQNALEGILGIGSNWFTITGLYEFHSQFSTPGLGWFVGGGAHVGALDRQYYYNDRYYGSGGFILGVDGILGLDYTIPGAPLNLSLDWKPDITLASFSGVYAGEFGLSVRYTIGR